MVEVEHRKKNPRFTTYFVDRVANYDERIHREPNRSSDPCVQSRCRTRHLNFQTNFLLMRSPFIL